MGTCFYGYLDPRIRVKLGGWDLALWPFAEREKPVPKPSAPGGRLGGPCVFARRVDVAFLLSRGIVCWCFCFFAIWPQAPVPPTTRRSNNLGPCATKPPRASADKQGRARSHFLGTDHMGARTNGAGLGPGGARGVDGPSAAWGLLLGGHSRWSSVGLIAGVSEAGWGRPHLHAYRGTYSSVFPYILIAIVLGIADRHRHEEA